MKETLPTNFRKQFFNTPIIEEAFLMTDTEKMNQIEFHFTKIMETLGLDLSDDSLQDTPRRVAKMYVKEIFSGLDPANKPSKSVFHNLHHQVLS